MDRIDAMIIRAFISNVAKNSIEVCGIIGISMEELFFRCYRLCKMGLIEMPDAFSNSGNIFELYRFRENLLNPFNFKLMVNP